MMRSRRVAALTAVVVVAGATWTGAAEAQKSSSGNGHRPPVSTWSAGESAVTQCPGADTCTAGGTHSVGTTSAGATYGSVASQAALVRTAPYTGSDQASHLDDVALSFTLSKPAHSVTAEVHFTGITLGDGFGATSPDGHIDADAGVGMQAVDSACKPASCGPTAGRVDSLVAYAEQVAGVDAKPLDPATDPSASRTLQVTLSTADGTDLPAGTITVFAFTEVGVWLSGLGCGTPTQPLCDSGVPHTGRAATAISATVDSITYTVS